jgi:hypothetical protein
MQHEESTNTQALSATSILSLLDTTKSQRKTFAEEVITKLENSEANPLIIHCQVKAMENLLKQFTDAKEGGELEKRYKAMVLAEAEKHGKKFQFHNGEFQIKEAGQKYDWSQCGDAELLQNMDVYESLGKAIKERQEFLKKVPAVGMEVVDSKTGEISMLYPPAVSSTTTVSVSIK